MVLNAERAGKVPLTSLGEPPKLPQTGLTAKVTSARGSTVALVSETDNSKRGIIEHIPGEMKMVNGLFLRRVVIYSFLRSGLVQITQVFHVSMVADIFISEFPCIIRRLSL